MANQKILKRVVDAAEPGARDTFIWDTELRGFGLRVTPKGAKAYVLQYRMKEGPARRTTIGGHGNPWTPETARREAERLLFQIRHGTDPVEEAREKRREIELFAFDVYADRFLELYIKENWRNWKSGEGVLKAAKTTFGKKPIASIKRSDVAEMLDGYADRPAMKKLVHSTLRKLFNWAADRGDIEHSPIAGMKAPRGVPARRRVLSHEELVAVWIAAGKIGDIWRPLFRLLVLTLQRRDEVASLDWSEIDLDSAVWVLPPERAKNNEANRIPLSPLAMAEIGLLTEQKSGLLFTSTGITSVSGFSKVKTRLDEEMLGVLRQRAAARGEDPAEVKFVPWRIHDLRRTGATNLQALGVPIEVTEAVLNHISGTRAGVAGVYNRFRYDPEKKRALDAWSSYLNHLILGDGDGTNVRPLVRYAHYREDADLLAAR